MDGFNALVDVHITGIKVENGSVECRTSDGHVWVWNFASVGDPPEIQSNPNALIGTPASITNLWLFGADPGERIDESSTHLGISDIHVSTTMVLQNSAPVNTVSGIIITLSDDSVIQFKKTSPQSQLGLAIALHKLLQACLPHPL